MLQGLRKNAKIVIYIVAAVFILSMAIGGLTGMFISRPYVARIANRKIHYEEYSEMLKNAYTNYMQQNPESEIDDAVMKQINTETWTQMVASILYNNEIKRLKIKVTDADVLDKLKNPPEDIRAIDEFKTNGVFDYDKYQTLLLQNPDFAYYLEDRFRGSLPYEKLFNVIKSQVNISEEDVRQEYYDMNNKADAKIIFFDPQKIEIGEITEEDQKIYYEEHKEDYKREPASKLKFIRVKLQPSESDISLFRAKADSIYNELINGLDFAEAARLYSDDPGGANGGDLGYFARGRMVKEFEEAAFSLKVGGLSEPVLSQFGWHIIKVDDRRLNDMGEEETKASHILIKTEASEATRENLVVIAQDIFEAIREKDIETVADDFGYTVTESREFQKDAKFISGIGQQEELVKFAFSSKVGKVHEPILMTNGDYLVAQVSEKLGVHYQPFEEVKQTISRAIENERKLEAVYQKAEAFAASHESQEYLPAATRDGWEIIEATDITISKNLPKIR
ncbi:MAG: peptidylprolyl isomerase, partial [Candidatus Cloacimonetes bacterium]|nr:peptidylprolyl isomerase [Candidatus Cloacimonadota bacterium]